MKLLLGRHCSVKSPDYLLGAVREAVSLNSSTLTFFLGSPHGFFRKTVSELKREEFFRELKENGMSVDKIVVHGSYLINLANTVKPSVFFSSIEIIKKELKLMEQLDLNILVIHLGSSLQAQKEEGLKQIVKGLNEVLDSCQKGIIALETSHKQNKVGGSFKDLSYIINNVKEKKRVGVCWDTCHLYAAGYDIKEKLESVVEEFKKEIGLSKLLAIHINDSMYELGSEKDRHENIGFGKIGVCALKKIVHFLEFSNIPKLLETPRRSDDFSKKEIELLLKL